MKRLKIILAMMTLSAVSFAQEGMDQPAMADLMRSNGKIYVVVGVLVIIFLVLMLYLISLDRKLKRLEKEGK